MTVARRLQGAFVVYVLLLASVVVYHVRTIQRAVSSGRALTEISSRLRAVSTDQLSRLTQMSDDAEKFLVTLDRGYFDRLQGAAHAFDDELSRLNGASLTPAERSALVPLALHWRTFQPMTAGLLAVEQATPNDARAAVSRFQLSLEQIRDETQQLGAASQDAMSRELSASERAAATAARVSWIAALAALVLSILLSAQLVRSIVGPLGRLTEGTREVSAGRFSHRIDASGDDELAQVGRDFNTMIERLGELDRMKRDFVAKVSHDLKTPLTSMQETIAVLLDGVAGPLSPKQRHFLELNLESSQRLSAMLTKLLDLSRIEAGLEPDFQMLDVAQLVARSVARTETMRSERGYRIEFTEPERRVLVRGDVTGLAQVLDNLLENAIKFSPSGGIVDVRVSELRRGEGHGVARQLANARGIAGDAILLTVADEGPGVPDEEKERVFTRFYQTEAGRAARGRGVGLGLTICREIVDAHGGAIWVSDNEPHGSVFHVLLPGAVGAAEALSGSPAAIGARA